MSYLNQIDSLDTKHKAVNRFDGDGLFDAMFRSGFLFVAVVVMFSHFSLIFSAEVALFLFSVLTMLIQFRISGHLSFFSLVPTPIKTLGLAAKKMIFAYILPAIKTNKPEKQTLLTLIKANFVPPHPTRHTVQPVLFARLIVTPIALA